MTSCIPDLLKLGEWLESKDKDARMLCLKSQNYHVLPTWLGKVTLLSNTLVFSSAKWNKATVRIKLINSCKEFGIMPVT